MAEYDSKKKSLEQQLRDEANARRQSITTSEPGTLQFNMHDKTEQFVRDDTPAYRMALPGYSDPIFDDDVGADFLVSTPSSAVPVLKDVHETWLSTFQEPDNDAYREQLLPSLVDKLRHAGVSFRHDTTASEFGNALASALAAPVAEGTFNSSKAKYEDIKAQKERVLRMQQSLAEQGFYDGDLDGVYGAQTVAAIRKAQKAGVNVPPTR